ncbi:F0F1 ATP synthase subunit delta [Brachybacterium sp. J144]|uniref:F0F1 ATP synthase subunit delta n=1 Tax=unclassified Brachybacterium TaxID=2623841 RepID=UPI002E77FCE3|nr:MULTISPECIES: F0F1 ATP synthase subunit delta [unclassified Brachybacterium]MEE1617090.1 F0F1 ATP synthase subunit delta [Brachybacterium sp. J153]MEE1649729.1 F0F1 ATP synthase subunit delta [Brachybacterium sp. J144]
MRGTSSASFDEALRQAETVFRTVSGSGPLEPLAEELFSTADAVDGSNQLVRLLSDPGRPAAVKEEAVRSLFAGRISAEALELLLEVVRRRWSEQEDILDALELLGVSALLAQAESEGVLEQVEVELFQVKRLIDGSGELTGALDGERENPGRRAQILSTLLSGRTHRLTAALAARAAGRRSDVKPARRVAELASFASERRRRALASVSSAVPLSEAQQGRLSGILAGLYGRQVQMNFQVDPDVVGGLRIQVGDDLYDATVLARLAQARRQLVA